jgi:hypothetical protein
MFSISTNMITVSYPNTHLYTVDVNISNACFHSAMEKDV